MRSAGIKPETLAVVGLDAAWGGCGGQDADGAAAFERMVYAGGQQFAQPGYNPRVKQVDDWLRLSASRALADAGLKPGGGSRVAVLWAVEGGASFWLEGALFNEDLSAQANPLVAAAGRAQEIFALDAADAVLFAASSGEIDWEDIPLAEGNAAGFDRSTHGWKAGAGAGAVVWMPYERAAESHQRVYALLRGMTASGGNDSSLRSSLPVAPSLEDVRACCRAALEQAEVAPEEIGLVEMFASGVDAIDGVEIAGVCQAYRQPDVHLHTAAGSVQDNAGYLFAAAGLAALVRAALCLYHRTLPAVPVWTGPKLPALWRGSPFYFQNESKSWFARSDRPGRWAGINLIGKGGSFAHLILSEDAQPLEQPGTELAMGGLHLIPLVGSDLAHLIEQLEELKSALPYAADLNTLAAEWHEEAAGAPDAPFGLALIGRCHEDLLREIDLALKSVPDVFEKGGDWQTPGGSYFSASPVGQQGEVALVYPGAFNSYPWVGKDLFHLFPWLHSRSYGRTTDLGRVMRERLLYPRSLAAPTKEDQAACEANLLGDAAAMLSSGTTIAILFTYILEEAFGVRPGAVFGYSLGENSMMYATRIWQEGDDATQKLEVSPVFQQQLAGPQNAIRACWGLPAVGTAGDSAIWNNYILMASWEAVQPALEQEGHVYLTHINAPRQVVIGGDPAGCKRVIAKVRCSSLQAPFDYALHCEPTRSQFAGLAELHNWPIERIPPMKMYSAYDYQPLTLQVGAEGGRVVSEKIAQMLTSPLDFPRLVRKVYEDGARVFIEAGAGSNCTRWVDESLKGQPHAALSVNRRGTDDYTSLVRLLARLHSQRVPVDLSALYLPLRERISL